MKRILLVLLVFILSVNFCFAEEKVKKVSPTEQKHAEIQLPAKEYVEYWVIRSQAITELIPFLTRKRTEMRDNLKLFTDYLQAIDKGEDFLASDPDMKFTPTIYATALGIYEDLVARGVEIPENLLSWEQTAEFAMRFVLQEGYMPVDVVGNEEFVMYKKICSQKERYGKKVQKEVRELMNKCVRIWTYLGTIDKQSSFRVFAHKEKEAQKKAHDEMIRVGRAELAAARTESQRRKAVANNKLRQQQYEDNLQLRREALAAEERLRSQQLSAQERAALQQQQQQNYIYLRSNRMSTRYSGYY